MNNENQRIVPFLTFHGNAEEAINYYAANLPGAKIELLKHFEEGQHVSARRPTAEGGVCEANVLSGDTGKVLVGILSLFGQRFQFMDMESAYDCPPFSWATSFLVSCSDTAEYDALFNALAQGGTVMMQEENFMHYRKVAWVTDKFGVTWQPVLQ